MKVMVIKTTIITRRIFDPVQLIHYKCPKVNVKRGGSYIESSDWIKNKSTINSKNEDDKCFQYVPTVTLNYKEIDKSHSERVSYIRVSFINKYNWHGINHG